MKFLRPLQPAIFLRRYKRFLVDVLRPDQSEITVHCPNTGSMAGCLSPGCDVRLLDSAVSTRKYRYTLELTRPGPDWIGVNTSRTNALVREALETGVVTEFGRIDHCQAEVRVSPYSRLDFMVQSGAQRSYLEVKNCTLAENGVALFPDAVTARGNKHLHELIALRRQGYGAAVLFCVQRPDATRFSPASHIDPAYSIALQQAFREGVRVIAYQADVDETGIEIRRRLPVELGRSPLRMATARNVRGSSDKKVND